MVLSDSPNGLLPNPDTSLASELLVAIVVIAVLKVYTPSFPDIPDTEGVDSTLSKRLDPDPCPDPCFEPEKELDVELAVFLMDALVAAGKPNKLLGPLSEVGVWPMLLLNDIPGDCKQNAKTLGALEGIGGWQALLKLLLLLVPVILAGRPKPEGTILPTAVRVIGTEVVAAVVEVVVVRVRIWGAIIPQDTHRNP